MFNLVHSLDTKIQENENKIEEIDRLIDLLNQQTADLWKDLDLTPEQLQTFIQTRSNFTDDNWEYLLKKKKELDEQLKKTLNSIQSPLKTREKMKQRQNAAAHPHWLYVK